MKETYYFTHDYNTRNDIKIKKLISKLGFEGYGIFWALIEDLYQNANALPTDYDCIAFDLRCNSDVLKSIINDFDLFVFNDNYFSSLSVERRLNERNDKSIKARESALKRWNNANALPTQYNSNAIKEIKRKKKKENKIIIPAIEEIKKYFLDNGYTENSAVKFFEYYDCADWKDSKGNPVKSWKQKAQAVWFKDENKIIVEKPKQKVFENDLNSLRVNPYNSSHANN